MDVALVNPVRTPFGLYMGSLSSLNARDLAAFCLRDLIAKTSVNPADVNEVIAGWAMPDFYAPNIARVAALDAGFPESEIGVQLTTGIQALEYAADRIRAGEGDLYAVVAVESSSAVKNALPKTTNKRTLLGPRLLIDPLWELYKQDRIPLGAYADNLAEQLGITRQQQDEYAALSHKRAFKATKKYKGEFTDAIAIPDRPVYDGMPAPGTSTRIASDEGVRMNASAASFSGARTDERFAGYFPCAPTITLENSAPYADGAVALLVTTPERAASLGLTATAFLDDIIAVGSRDPLLAPALALEKTLEVHGIAAADLTAVELPELFACQLLANQLVLREKGIVIPAEGINVNGGALALGEAYAATSLRMVASLAHELNRRGGKGIAATMTQAGVGRAALLRR